MICGVISKVISPTLLVIEIFKALYIERWFAVKKTNQGKCTIMGCFAYLIGWYNYTSRTIYAHCTPHCKDQTSKSYLFVNKIIKHHFILTKCFLFLLWIKKYQFTLCFIFNDLYKKQLNINLKEIYFYIFLSFEFLRFQKKKNRCKWNSDNGKEPCILSFHHSNFGFN